MTYFQYLLKSYLGSMPIINAALINSIINDLHLIYQHFSVPFALNLLH